MRNSVCGIGKRAVRGHRKDSKRECRASSYQAEWHCVNMKTGNKNLHQNTQCNFSFCSTPLSLSLSHFRSQISVSFQAHMNPQDRVCGRVRNRNISLNIDCSSTASSAISTLRMVGDLKARDVNARFHFSEKVLHLKKFNFLIN